MFSTRRPPADVLVAGQPGRTAGRVTLGLSFRRFRWRAGLLGGCAGLAGCGADVSGPEAVEGIYALRQLNAAELPYDHEGLGCCTYLDGALRLDGGGYELSIQARNRNTGLVFTATEWGTYTGQVSTLAFAPDSFAVEPIGLDAGTVSADSVRVTFGGEGPGSPDQFRGLFVRGL